MHNSLLDQGLGLMTYGMGTVFVFLTLLVICVVLMSAFIRKYLPVEDQPDVAAPTSAPVVDAAPGVDAVTLEVIQQAIYQHRAKR